MIAGITMACFVTGLIAGWLLRSIFIRDEISRIEERAEREVNHWQRETARAQSISDQLACQLAAHTGQLPSNKGRSQADDR